MLQVPAVAPGHQVGEPGDVLPQCSELRAGREDRSELGLVVWVRRAGSVMSQQVTFLALGGWSAGAGAVIALRNGAR